MAFAQFKQGTEAGVLLAYVGVLAVFLLKLRDLSLQHDTNIISGNTIITSGKGGIYPQGLVIGYVDDVVIDPSGLNVYATVDPAAEIQDLTHIFVITDFSVSE